MDERVFHFFMSQAQGPDPLICGENIHAGRICSSCRVRCRSRTRQGVSSANNALENISSIWSSSAVSDGIAVSGKAGDGFRSV